MPEALAPRSPWPGRNEGSGTPRLPAQGSGARKTSPHSSGCENQREWWLSDTGEAGVPGVLLKGPCRLTSDGRALGSGTGAATRKVGAPREGLSRLASGRGLARPLPSSTRAGRSHVPLPGPPHPACRAGGRHQPG